MKLFSRLKKQSDLSLMPLPQSSDSPQPTFEVLLPKTPELRNQFIEYVKLVNHGGGLYHQLDFGNGIVINGLYNMAEYVSFYEIPTNLEGKTILDIGTASGYFALECARRGGSVTAIDIYENQFLQVFLSLTETPIRYVKKSVYEIAEEFGEFDMVICGSLLLHLSDVLGALRKIRSVCKGQAIISTACPEDSMTNPRPVCEFIGEKGEDGDYWTYWSIGSIALQNMLLAAGFVQVIHVHHFTLTSEPGYRSHANPHVVMSGLV